MTKNIVSSIVALGLLSGCAYDVASPQPTIDKTEQSIKTPSRYKNAPHNKLAIDGWLKRFNDYTLIKLVKEAQQNNPNLQLAYSDIKHAMALLKLSESNLYPDMDFRGSYQYRNYEASSKHDKGNFVFSINWEPDIWGKLSTQKEADYEYMLSKQALYCYAKESLAANTAKAWFMLSSDKMIYNFNKQVVSLHKKAQSLISKQAQIGQGNYRDVHMIQGMLASSQNDAVTAMQKMQLDTRALEILVGRYPSNALKAHKLAHLPSKVPSKVPLDLLNTRPDIIAAKYRVAEAFHNVEVANKLRLPSINISLQGGYDVIQDSLAKAIGNIFMPIFDAGAVQSHIDAATAQQQAAIASYKAVVLNAYKEVEDAYALEKQLASRYTYISRMTNEFYQAYKMTNENYKIGQGTLLDVLQVQTQWINAKIAKIQIQKDRLLNRVNLYLALGGHYSNQKATNK